MMLDNYGVTEANWRDALKDRGPGAPQAPPDFATSETPRYVVASSQPWRLIQSKIGGTRSP
jgi:hypothetical protein